MNASTVRETVTLNKFIFHKIKTYREYMRQYMEDPIFATPSTLFCTGAYVDSIDETGVVGGDERENGQFISFACIVQKQRLLTLSRVSNIRFSNTMNRDRHYTDIVTEDVTPDGFIFNEGATYVDPMQRYHANADSNYSTTNGSWDTIIDGLIQLAAFFILNPDHVMPWGDPGEFGNARFKRLIGKTYFITKKGLVGIATAPVQKGDILALMHDAPFYFILREADNQEGDAKGEQKHRIVARAAVQDDHINIAEWFKSLSRREFRIV